MIPTQFLKLGNMAVKFEMIVKNVRSGSETSSWDEVINDGIQEKNRDDYDPNNRDVWRRGSTIIDRPLLTG